MYAAVWSVPVSCVFVALDWPCDTLAVSPPLLAGAAHPEAVRVRHRAADDAIFFDDDYIIRGVAGAILWRMLREHVASGRDAFAALELRHDPRLRLPPGAENLDARLVLLRRRLEARESPIRVERFGRGRYRVTISKPIELDEFAPPAPFEPRPVLPALAA